MAKKEITAKELSKKEALFNTINTVETAEGKLAEALKAIESLLDENDEQSTIISELQEKLDSATIEAKEKITVVQDSKKNKYKLLAKIFHFGDKKVTEEDVKADPTIVDKLVEMESGLLVSI